MVYTSLEFFLLFAATFLLYLNFTSRAARLVILTAASLAFYAWAGIFDFLIFLFVVGASYLAAFLSQKNPGRKRFWITAGVLVLCVHLIFWKYSPWILENLQLVFPGLHGGEKLYLPLPIGISFFTFQGIAFLVDLGRGDAPMMSFREYLLFKSFFAQLIAGPIVRAKELVPQLRTLKSPDLDDLIAGSSLFTLGVIKKLVIADHLSLFVTDIFAAPQKFDRATLVWGALAFTTEIWADFSGYTDMGRGTARMLGIRLPENFLAPMLARTPTEIWKRWHITLSRWLRDYVFFPLNRSIPIRNRLLRSGLSALITFLVAGMWHGANWTFVCWGLWIASTVLLEMTFTYSFVGRIWEETLPASVRTMILVPLTLSTSIIGLALFRSASLAHFFILAKSLWIGGAKDSLMGSARQIYWSCSFGVVLQFVFYYDFSKQSWPMLELARGILNRIRPATALKLTHENRFALALLGGIAGTLMGIALVASIAHRQYETFNSFIYFQF